MAKEREKGTQVIWRNDADKGACVGGLWRVRDRFRGLTGKCGENIGKGGWGGRVDVELEREEDGEDGGGEKIKNKNN